MARVRFIGSEPVTVPELGSREIQPDEVVEVPDARFEGYVCQVGTWEAVEEPRPPEPNQTELAPPARKIAARPQKTED
ncbi:hypothetical protein [Streptomyces griseoluteus]|uniref:hypothetical protein n=1 Tax=Streptomyces griseoluteus TaxID=29306 RepID=UPI00381C0600